jgi:hypothetical protein
MRKHFGNLDTITTSLDRFAIIPFLSSFGGYNHIKGSRGGTCKVMYQHCLEEHILLCSDNSKNCGILDS